MVICFQSGDSSRRQGAFGLAQAADQFRQSDVTTWGIVALICCAFAVISANVSALVPDAALAGLHSSRIQGGNVSQLRAEVAALQAETARLRRDATALETRFALADEAGNAVTRRVGALEVSVPKLLEALPAGAEIDRTNITAAIGSRPVLTYEAEGGSVAVSHVPMPEATRMANVPNQPMPSVVPNPMAFALALGPEVPAEEASTQWQDLTLKVGTLLIGLSPLVADQAESSAKRIVAGPIADAEQAQRICEQMVRVGIDCMPVPFTGNPLF